NWDTGFTANAAQDIEAVHARQHHVEHDEKVLAGDGGFEATLSVMRALYQKAFGSEILSHKSTEFYVVVDDQNAVHTNHFSSTTGRSACGYTRFTKLYFDLPTFYGIWIADEVLISEL